MAPFRIARSGCASVGCLLLGFAAALLPFAAQGQRLPTNDEFMLSGGFDETPAAYVEDHSYPTKPAAYFRSDGSNDGYRSSNSYEPSSYMDSYEGESWDGGGYNSCGCDDGCCDIGGCGSDCCDVGCCDAVGCGSSVGGGRGVPGFWVGGEAGDVHACDDRPAGLRGGQPVRIVRDRPGEGARPGVRDGHGLIGRVGSALGGAETQAHGAQPDLRLRGRGCRLRSIDRQ